MRAGLADIHAVGLLHNDIKGSNILVCDGQVVISDLGLATPWLNMQVEVRHE